MSPNVLLDLIQAHPQAFSLMDRYSMDYAEALINAGVIVLTNKWGENAKKALSEEFPELAKKITLHIPDENSRRVGQSVAAASLPKLD